MGEMHPEQSANVMRKGSRLIYTEQASCFQAEVLELHTIADKVIHTDSTIILGITELLV